MKKPSLIKFFPSWIVFGLSWLLAHLPYKLMLVTGIGIGKFAKALLASRKKAADVNLQICFPELSAQQRQNLLNKSFDELGIMLTQTLKAFLANTKQLEKTALITGGEHIEACLQKKQGVLLVAGHFTALDMGGKILCKNYPVAGMYRPHKHPLTEYIVTRSRLKYAAGMFKRDELRAIVKHLKQGGILWYAPDQDYRRGQSVFVPFFGRPAATITATHQLARLSHCKVLYFHVQRNPKPPYYSLNISPPMENFPTNDAVADTARVNKEIEKMVKKCPEQYLWVHKRFKTVQQEEENPY